MKETSSQTVSIMSVCVAPGASGMWCWPSPWSYRRSCSTSPQEVTVFLLEGWQTSTSKSQRSTFRLTGRFPKTGPNCRPNRRFTSNRRTALFEPSGACGLNSAGRSGCIHLHLASLTSYLGANRLDLVHQAVQRRNINQSQE